MWNDGCCSGYKAAGAWIWPLLPRLGMREAILQLPPHAFMASCLIMHTDTLQVWMRCRYIAVYGGRNGKTVLQPNIPLQAWFESSLENWLKKCNRRGVYHIVQIPVPLAAHVGNWKFQVRHPNTMKSKWPPHTDTSSNFKERAISKGNWSRSLQFRNSELTG